MKRSIKTLFVMLALTLMMIPASAFAKDYGISVNGVAVTDANAGDILGDGEAWYDVDNSTLIIGVLSEGKSWDIVSTSTGVFSVTPMHVSKSVTVTAAGELIILAGNGSPIAYKGDITVDAKGPVTITNNFMLTSEGKLTVINATDVTLLDTSEGSTAPMVYGDLSITATGNVFASSNHGFLSTGIVDVETEGDVYFGCNCATPLVTNEIIINTKGDVSLYNGVNQISTGKTSIKGGNVSLFNSIANYMITADLYIDATGNVDIYNETGGIAAGEVNIVNAANVCLNSYYKGNYGIKSNLDINATGNVEYYIYEGYGVNGPINVVAGGYVTISQQSEYNCAISTSSIVVDAAGDVLLGNENNAIVYGPLEIKNAANVSLWGAYSGPQVQTSLDVNATGNIDFSINEGFGVYGTMTAVAGGYISVYKDADYNNALVTFDMDLTAGDTVYLFNNNDAITYKSLKIESGSNVDIYGNYDGPQVQNSCEINSKGEVTFCSDNGFLVSGSTDITADGVVILYSSSVNAPIFVGTLDVTTNAEVYITSENFFIGSDVTTISAKGDIALMGNSSEYPMFTKALNVTTEGNLLIQNNGDYSVLTHPLTYSVGKGRLVYGFEDLSTFECEEVENESVPDEKFQKIETCYISYDITLEATKNGEADVQEVGIYGEIVNVTVIPDKDYVLDKITVVDENGNEIAVDGTSFVMTDSDVTVTVTFKYHTHEANEWKSDEAKHWKECGTCGQKYDEASHVMDSSNKCTVCGYEAKTVEQKATQSEVEKAPKTGDSTNVLVMMFVAIISGMAVVVAANKKRQ